MELCVWNFSSDLIQTNSHTRTPYVHLFYFPATCFVRSSGPSSGTKHKYIKRRVRRNKWTCGVQVLCLSRLNRYWLTNTTGLFCPSKFEVSHSIKGRQKVKSTCIRDRVVFIVTLLQKDDRWIVVPFPVATRHFSQKCYNRCICVKRKCHIGQVSKNDRQLGHLASGRA